MEEAGAYGLKAHSRLPSGLPQPERRTACRLQRFRNACPTAQQRVELEVNGSVVATHQWQDCEPWSAIVDIPAELVHIGANDLVVRAAYAAQPSEGDDPRQLSAGFTKLLLEPEKR